MTFRVEVKPELLDYAVRRAGFNVEEVNAKFKNFESWKHGETQPTYKQLVEFAKKTYIPLSNLLLTSPPDDKLPITDFRGREATQAPSGNLLDTVRLAQDRQDWYRQYALGSKAERIAWIGADTTGSNIVEAARRLRDLIGWSVACVTADMGRNISELRACLETAGVLVMISGVVGQNAYRKLDVAEFRGFALADDLAPVIFVNGSDSNTGKLFTLAHELGHLALGNSGVSSPAFDFRGAADEERWCNSFAAEFLVPEALFNQQRTGEPVSEQLSALAKYFGVSTQVILGRFREVGVIDWNTYLALLDIEASKAVKPKGGSGGSFYDTAKVRMSETFASAILESYLEGNTDYRETARLTSITKVDTLEKLALKLGIY